MTRPVYSTLFVAEYIAPGGPAAIIPLSDQVMVVRDIQVSTSFGSGATLIFQVNPGGVNALQWSPLAPGYFQAQWNGRIVIPPGFDALLVSTAGSWATLVSGYVLSNP